MGQQLNNSLCSNEKLLIVKAAVGGTQISRWLPENNDIYTTLISTIQNAIDGVAPASGNNSYEVEGMYWAQGGSDMFQATNYNSYEANLSNLPSQVRTDLNAPSMNLVYSKI